MNFILKAVDPPTRNFRRVRSDTYFPAAKMKNRLEMRNV